MNDEAKTIEMTDGRIMVPDRPVIPFIEGDGVGPDIWRAGSAVFEAAVAKAYDGRRRVEWLEVPAGEKAWRERGEWLPEETLEALERYKVGIKGPLTTPVGGGIRSINVAIRQRLDLYVCLRPVRYVPGVPAPVREPHKVDMVVFRENTEDVYAGIEWPSGSLDSKKIIDFMNREMSQNVRPDSAIGIKPMSPFGSKRLVRRAIQWALDQGRKSVTLVHKGNIMKFTEGAFRDWGYEVARDEFGDRTVAEADWAEGDDRVVIKDRIADAMFQQVLLRPDEYEVLAMPNLNGDYLSDALAAQVGGLGMAPGANMGDRVAVFEATHGTAPKYAGQDKINPGSLILSGALMFDYLGWGEAADLIRSALEKTVRDRVVTYDLARQLDRAEEVSCSRFGQAIIERM
ncbi:MAG: isocitrate dehydrogenase (NADP(+)) [Proteobacteria bacterium]|nr:isocitrate dehydrogenase (NADP(+)) [Pseudomonadota bacterium]